jgi:hypothetical protein
MKLSIYKILDDWVGLHCPIYTINQAIEEGDITEEEVIGYITLLLKNDLKEIDNAAV